MKTKIPIFQNWKNQSFVLSIVVAFVGFMVMVGWIFNISIFKSISPEWISMKVNTAICFLLAGLILMIFNLQKKKNLLRLANGSILIIIVIGIVSLLQYIFNFNAGIDELFFKDDAIRMGTSQPGRMALGTALCFILFGLSFLSLGINNLNHIIFQGLNLLVGVISLFAMISYLFGARQLMDISEYTAMAFHTSFTLFILMIANLLLRSESGMMKMITSNTSGGKLFRNMFPLVIIIIIFAGWLHFQVENAGYFNVRLNISIYITLIIIIFTIILFANARSLSKSQADLLQSNERYNLVAKAIHDSIWDMNIETGKIKRYGDGFKKLFGYDKQFFNSSTFDYTKLIHVDDLPGVNNSLEKVLTDPKQNYWQIEYRFQKANGEYAYVYDKGYIIRDANGKAIRMIGATQDITERADYIKAIEGQNKKLQEIAWTQSHIVRAPLARIMSLVNLLKEDEQFDDETNQLIRYLSISADEFDSIIRSIIHSSIQKDDTRL